MKHVKIFEEFINEFNFPNYAEEYTGMPEYTRGGLKNTKPIEDALTKVIDTVFSKPKYKKMWRKGSFSKAGIGFSFAKPESNTHIYPMYIDLMPTGDFLINAEPEELDKWVEKYGSQYDLEQAMSKVKVSPKQIKDAIKEIEAILNKYA